MKKIIKNLILIILLIPTVAKADMGAPTYEHLEAIVSNPNGTITYSGEKLEYGQKVSLQYEEKKDTDMYYYSCLNNDDKKCYQILAKDLSPLEYNLEDFKREKSIKMYAFDNTKMYSGPASYYEEIANIEIPVGTVLSSNYTTEEYMYVTYNGISGWVYRYSYGKYMNRQVSTLADYLDNFGDAYKQLKEAAYTIREVTLLDNPVGGKETGTKIPADTKLNVKYIYSHEPLAYYVYVEYQGNEGWILHDCQDEIWGDTQFVSLNNQTTIKFKVNKEKYSPLVELNVYDSIYEGAKIIGTLSKGEEVDVEYYVVFGHLGEYYYIKSNKNEGWIDFRYSSKLDKKITGNITLNNKSNVYEKKGEKSDPIATIDKYTSIPYYDKYEDEDGNMWYEIINYNGISGWVLDKSIEPQLPTIDQSKVETKEEIDKLYYILGGTIGLVVITWTTIVFVNKKKKTKDEDKKPKKKSKEKIAINEDKTEIEGEKITTIVTAKEENSTNDDIKEKDNNDN